MTCEFTCNTNKFKLLAIQVNRKYADPSICLIKWRAESRLWGGWGAEIGEGIIGSQSFLKKPRAFCVSDKYSSGVHQKQAIGLALLLLALLYCLDYLQISHTGSGNLILLEALVVVAPFLTGALAQHLKQTTSFLLIVVLGKLEFDYLIFIFQLELFYSDIPTGLSDWLPIALLRLILPVLFIGLGSATYPVFSGLFKKSH